MEKVFDFLYTKKMWVGGIVKIVSDVVLLIQVAAADESISFDEAKGIALAGWAALTTIGAMFGIYKARNAPPITTPTNGSTRKDF
jgi:hypothetical protein